MRLADRTFTGSIGTNQLLRWGLVIVLAAALLRIVPLPHEALWQDEFFTRHVIRQTPADALLIIREDMVHPPLYYYVERGVYQLLGDTPFGLRAFSLLCGLLLVVAVIGFTLDLTRGDAFAALAAATLVAVSDLQITQAQNARSYALYALEILVLAWVFLRMLRTPEHEGLRWAYALLSIVAVLTHYVAALFILALGPAVWAAHEPRRSAKAWVTLSVPAALAVGLWLLYVFPVYQARSGLGTQLGWIPKPDWPAAKLVAAQLIGMPRIPGGVDLSLGAGLLLLASAAWIWRRRSESGPPLAPASVILAGSLAVLPPAMLLAASRTAAPSFWIDRYLIPSQVFVAVAGGLCLGLVARVRTGLAVVALCGVVVLNDPCRLLGASLPRNIPYDQVAADLRRVRAPGELAIASDFTVLWPVNYYLASPDSIQRLALPNRTTRRSVRRATAAPGVRPWSNYLNAAPRLETASTLWLVRRSADRTTRDSLLGRGWREIATIQERGLVLERMGRP